jgi:hypothetical protein
LGLHYRNTEAGAFGAEGGYNDDGSPLHSKTYRTGAALEFR